MNWLRDVALAVARVGRCGYGLMTWEVVRLAHEEGVEVPGLDEGGDLDDDAAMNKANQAVGRRMGHLFGDRDRVSVDGHEVERQSCQDEEGRTKRRYVFRRPAMPEERGHAAADGGEGRIGGRIGGNEASIGENCSPATGSAPGPAPTRPTEGVPPYGAPYPPPMAPPMKPQCSPIPPMGRDLLPEGKSVSEDGVARSGDPVCEPIGGIGGKDPRPSPANPPFVDDGFLDDDWPGPAVPARAKGPRDASNPEEAPAAFGASGSWSWGDDGQSDSEAWAGVMHMGSAAGEEPG